MGVETILIRFGSEYLLVSVLSLLPESTQENRFDKQLFLGIPRTPIYAKRLILLRLIVLLADPTGNLFEQGSALWDYEWTLQS